MRDKEGRYRRGGVGEEVGGRGVGEKSRRFSRINPASGDLEFGEGVVR